MVAAMDWARAAPDEAVFEAGQSVWRPVADFWGLGVADSVIVSGERQAAAVLVACAAVAGVS